MLGGSFSDIKDNEFINLADEFNSLSAFMDKVEFAYSKGWGVWGKYSREVRGRKYEVAIQAKDEDENNERWDYYLRMEKEYFYGRLIEIFELEKSRVSEYEMKNFLASYLERIGQDTGNISEQQEGYDMAHNNELMEYTFRRNYSTELMFVARGQAYYALAQKVKQLLGLDINQNEDTEPGKPLGPKHRLVALYISGVFDHILNEFKTEFGVPGEGRDERLKKMLSLICGYKYKTNSVEYRSFKAEVAKLLSAIEQKKVEDYISEETINKICPHFFSAGNIDSQSVKRRFDKKVKRIKG